MLDKLLQDTCKKKFEDNKLKERMIAFLTKKKNFGVYQADNEYKEIEKTLIADLSDYLKQWLIGELSNGKIKDILLAELETQLYLELFRKGYFLK